MPKTWTKAKTLEGLCNLVRVYARAGDVPPHTWKGYVAVKKGHPEWPPVQNVVEHYGSVRAAMVEAGADESTLPRDGLEWEPWEDAIILENTADRVKRGMWPEIAKLVRRSVTTCKRRAWELKPE